MERDDAYHSNAREYFLGCILAHISRKGCFHVVIRITLKLLTGSQEPVQQNFRFPSTLLTEMYSKKQKVAQKNFNVQVCIKSIHADKTTNLRYQSLALWTEFSHPAQFYILLVSAKMIKNFLNFPLESMDFKISDSLCLISSPLH